MKTVMIVAADLDDCIGRDGDLPWHLPADLKRFKQLTMGHVVLMGSATYRSIAGRLKGPLPGRYNIVVSRQGRFAEGNLLFVDTVSEALAIARGVSEFAGREQFFVIGGASVYGQLLAQTDQVLLTRVEARSSGEVSLPENWLDGFEMVSDEPAQRSDDEPPYSFVTYERRPPHDG